MSSSGVMMSSSGALMSSSGSVMSSSDNAIGHSIHNLTSGPENLTKKPLTCQLCLEDFENQSKLEDHVIKVSVLFHVMCIRKILHQRSTTANRLTSLACAWFPPQSSDSL